MIFLYSTVQVMFSNKNKKKSFLGIYKKKLGAGAKKCEDAKKLYLYKALGINANVVLGYTANVQVICCKLVPCRWNCSIQLGDWLCISGSSGKVERNLSSSSLNFRSPTFFMFRRTGFLRAETLCGRLLFVLPMVLHIVVRISGDVWHLIWLPSTVKLGTIPSSVLYRSRRCPNE